MPRTLLAAIIAALMGAGFTWFAPSAPSPVPVAAPTASPDDAQVVNADLPDTLVAGRTYRASVTVRNTGTSTWDRTFRLGTVDDSDPFHARTREYMPQGASVAPGQTHTFSFDLTAPAAPGTYVTDWRMVHELVRWFGAVARKTVTVTAAASPDDAQVVSTTLPDTMVAGRTVQASVTMRNSGSSTWTRSSGFKLGTVDDSDPFHARPREWLPQGTTVAPGQSHTFRFALLAPQQVGSYATDWRMVHESVRWFGQVAAKTVAVTAPPPLPPVPRRSGLVRLSGNSLEDDQGKFNALGVTVMWAGWAYDNDRLKLERTLDFLSQNGYDYIRVLGVVGDPGGPDYWDGREIRWRDPGYRQMIAGLTDLAFDTYGLRVEWTLIGDGQVAIPSDSDRYTLCDWFLQMSRTREEKIILFEIANEAWQNGFSGSSGNDQLRALSRYMKDRTNILVAASAARGHHPADIQYVYSGGVADIATVHFDRTISLTDGNWRPVRQPWEHEYISGVPVGSNNEPIGPGASVNVENDPVKLNAAAIATYVSNLPMYVFHTGAGVRGLPQDREISDMPGARDFRFLDRFIPGDLASWDRRNAHWSNSPFKVYAGDRNGQLRADTMWPDFGSSATSGVVRAYGDVKGDRFLVFPMGIKNSVTMEPRRNMEFDVIDPMTGTVVDHKVLNAGDRFRLSGAATYVLKGRFR